jgi:hypothetical protein
MKEGRKKEKVLKELGLRKRDISIRLEELELVESIIQDLNKEKKSQRSFRKISKHSSYRHSSWGCTIHRSLFLSSPLLLLTILNERFPDSKHDVCAYLGLVPSLHQSGGYFTNRTHNKAAGRTSASEEILSNECARNAVRKGYSS